jgi:hypothetical protein
MNLNDFNSNIGKQNFINKIATFLEINPNRITIMSIISGSTIVKYSVIPDLGSIDQSSSFNPSSPEVVE